jgi:FkbM family methyltransferase
VPRESHSPAPSGVLFQGPRRILTTGHNFLQECRACVREGRNLRASLRLCADFALSRILPYLPKRLRNRERQVQFRSGARLRYRLNRGDIQGIREVWLERAYRLPFAISNGVLVDLGANIGLTSVWLAKEYGFSRVIAVEPDSSNAALVRKNLDLNGLNAQVVQAAVGPNDGTARFQTANESNLGQVSQDGDVVKMVSMQTILERFGLSDLDLVKMDIEGSEQALLTGPSEWLSRTRAMIAEFHPPLIDYPRLTGLLEQRGFTYVRSNTAFPNNMDSFYRPHQAPAE